MQYIQEKMNYNNFIYTKSFIKLKLEGGFDSKFINIDNLIIVLKYAHIARRSRFNPR